VDTTHDFVRRWHRKAQPLRYSTHANVIAECRTRLPYRGIRRIHFVWDRPSARSAASMWADNAVGSRSPSQARRDSCREINP
jgi:hypothetical protein